MDGFKESENVIVIGATNFEKALDSAVKRPGRFDKTINVPYPDIRGREKVPREERKRERELWRRTYTFIIELFIFSCSNTTSIRSRGTVKL